MMRLAILSIAAVMLAACSGSSRVEGVVPGWANPSPQDGNRQLRAAPDPQMQGAGRPDGRPSEQ
jgi:hypothetical protein